MLSLVRGVVETDALATAIGNQVRDLAAEAVVLTTNWLEEDDLGLNEPQKIMFVSVMLRCFDGLDAKLRQTIESGIRRDG
jgi:hypothetical protein